MIVRMNLNAQNVESFCFSKCVHIYSRFSSCPNTTGRRVGLGIMSQHPPVIPNPQWDLLIGLDPIYMAAKEWIIETA